VLLDLQMPIMDGFETTKWLKENHPSVRVLVLSMYTSDLARIRLLKMGVRGILAKDIHPSELKKAIETTMSTGYYYSGQTTTTMASLLTSGEITLSANEMRLLELVCSEMGVSPRTIDNYRDTLFSKLNVKSRAGLILVAMRNGLIKPD
jgi:two-component system, NarL family, invasion response regulator UvrY